MRSGGGRGYACLDARSPVGGIEHDATDTLLLYYAGHGLVDRRSELHLALTGSDQQRIYTAVSYNIVRDVLLESRATRRIVILDCCYSGRALGQMASPVTTIVNEASAEGTYVLAAAAENKAALAPQGARYTAFTGELLQIIQGGIADHGPLLDLDSIYSQLQLVMRGKGLPIPQKRDRNTAGRLNLINNRGFQEHSISEGTHSPASMPLFPTERPTSAAELHIILLPDAISDGPRRGTGRKPLTERLNWLKRNR